MHAMLATTETRMSDHPAPRSGALLRAWPGLWFGLVALAAMLTGLGLLPVVPLAGLVLLAAGSTVLLVGAGLSVQHAVRAARRDRAVRAMSAVLSRDPCACLLADPRLGQVVWANPAAAARLGVASGDPCAAILRPWIVAPAERAGRLHDQVSALGRVDLQIDTGTGQLLFDLAEAASGLVLWRLQGAQPAETTPLRGPEPGAGQQDPKDNRPQDAGSTQSVPGFDGLPVGLALLDEADQVTRINTEGRRLLGLARDEALDLTRVLEGPGRPLGDWLADMRAGKAPNRSEILRAPRSGDSTFLQVTLRRLGREDADRLLMVLSDATDFKELEDRFSQSQKMHAVGQLAGGVAHDFNNLLTAILGYCDLLLLRHDRFDPDYPDLIQIQQNANRAAGLVRQLLAFSRKTRMEPEVLDVEETLCELAHLLNRLLGERVTLTLVHGVDMGQIRADRRQVEQVLMNLSVNARDAMPMGGEIRIESRMVTLDRDLLRDKARVPAGTYAQIIVQDEGTGIAPEHLSKVFEPFFTTKSPGKGTGLGLSTVYGIVKQTGGFIFVDSELGKGTSFTLYFAVHDPATDAADPAPDTGVLVAAHPDPDAPRPGQQPPEPATIGAILLVEDEAPVRAFTARALQMRGHSVIEADCGEAALRILEDPDLHVDLFVSDVVMPGMDGPSWVQQARKERPDVPAIFISGYAEEHLPQGSADVPDSVFLGKPYSLQDLTGLVSRELGRQGAAARPVIRP